MKYAFGFYCEAECNRPGSSYLLSVIFIPISQDLLHMFMPVVVWSANMNNLVTVDAVLKFTDEGDLILEDSNKNSTVWSAGTSGKSVVSINLTDTGNLVLFDKNNVVVWQSFDHPTDTLLRGQKLMLGKKLVPRVSTIKWTEKIQLSLALTAHGLYAVAGTKPPLSYYSFPSELSDDSYAAWENDTFYLYSGKEKRVIKSYSVNVL
ncbi:hypothetical protein MLD38_033293 [Melastoma candidum]|uniref:Uncharacterized protein n=1 Tax=Melastoma candidum TaxID=119954 RepID=A0ACB9MA03_9MYRT|nr:hypothetical protein MLD38_033293 [Melastoma candidum]